MKKYTCGRCNFFTDSEKRYNRHRLSKGHLKRMPNDNADIQELNDNENKGRESFVKGIIRRGIETIKDDDYPEKHVRQAILDSIQDLMNDPTSLKKPPREQAMSDAIKQKIKEFVCGNIHDGHDNQEDNLQLRKTNMQGLRCVISMGIISLSRQLIDIINEVLEDDNNEAKTDSTRHDTDKFMCVVSMAILHISCKMIYMFDDLLIDDSNSERESNESLRLKIQLMKEMLNNNHDALLS